MGRGFWEFGKLNLCCNIGMKIVFCLYFNCWRFCWILILVLLGLLNFGLDYLKRCLVDDVGKLECVFDENNFKGFDGEEVVLD